MGSVFLKGTKRIAKFINRIDMYLVNIRIGSRKKMNAPTHFNVQAVKFGKIQVDILKILIG